MHFMKYSIKNYLNYFRDNIFVSSFLKNVFTIYFKNVKYSNNKNENIETMCRFVKVKNEFLRLEKVFIDLKDGELKDKEIKSKRKIEKLMFQPIIVSINDMDKFEQNEMKKEIPKKTNLKHFDIIKYT